MIEMVGAEYGTLPGFSLRFSEWPEYGALRIPIDDARAAIEAIARAHDLTVEIVNSVHKRR